MASSRRYSQENIAMKGLVRLEVLIILSVSLPIIALAGWIIVRILKHFGT